MSIAESETSRVTTAVSRTRPIHVKDLEKQEDSEHQSVNSGRAFLKVVAYPWGVEFELPDGEESK